MARRKNTYYDPAKEESTGRKGVKDEVVGVTYIEVIGSDEEEVKKPVTSEEPVKEDPVKQEEEAPVCHTLKDLVYGINQPPAWYMCIFLAIQQVFAMFGTSVATVMLVVPSLCISSDVVALSGLIATTFFCSGLATLLQSVIGVRLPILSGSSFTYVTPVMAILATMTSCSVGDSVSSQYTNITMMVDYGNNLTTTAAAPPTTSEWKLKLQEIQSGILIASLIEIVIGLSGVVGFVLQWVGPLTLSSTMTLIGLQLFDVASERASQQWWLALVTVLLIAMFSQFTRNLAVPACRFKKGEGCTKETTPLFLMFPILLAVFITWMIYIILQVTGTIQMAETLDCNNMTYFCNNVMDQAPWFRIPYPFQYGRPILSSRAVTGIIAGVVASVVESIGDYYACARMSSAPTLPLHAVNRGIAVQGLGTLIFGMFGCPLGTVSYTENIGAIGTTRVASRRVIQVAAVILLLFGVFTKFSAVFVVVPDPIKGGLLIVLFGMVTGIGISNLQFVDLNSSRNLFILGFSLFFGITLPKYVDENRKQITVGQPQIDEILRILLSTGLFVGGLSAMVLDNTIPGTAKERGLLALKKCREETEEQNALSQEIYGFPIGKDFFDKYEWARFIPILPTFDETLMKVHKKRKGKNSN